MTSRSCTSLLLAFSLVLAFAPASLRGQGTDLGTIRGTVTDTSGAVVVNATVDLTDEATKVVLHYKTNSHGDYEASALQAGRYRATVTAPGFGTSVVNRIELTGTASVSANAVLRVSTDASIEVSSDAATIDTENQTISETLEPRAIIELPRNSRDIYSFLYINPNITQGSEPGEFKFLGGQSFGASFSVDGQRSNGGIFGTATQTEPSLESVGELNVLSNSFSAEYAGVANVRVTTKRGGNAYHGSLFYNNQNSALSAWTLSDKANQVFFQPTTFHNSFSKARFNITDAGGSFGGKILKLKKTWFFLAYEHNGSISPAQITGNVPHPSVQAGDFSQVQDAGKPNVPSDVTLTADEIASDTVGGLGKQFITIPQRLINPISAKIVSLYFPHPGAGSPINSSNGSIANYSTSEKGSNGQHLGDLRIDHDFNDANRLFGVYHASGQSIAGNPVSGAYTGLGLLKTDRLNNSVSVSYTHVFSPRIVNEARGGFNRQKLYTHSNSTVQGFLQTVGFSPADITAYGAMVGPLELTRYGNPVFGLGYDRFSSGGRSADRNLSQNLATFGDTVTLNFGRHNIRVGLDFVRNQAVDGFAASRGNPSGRINYGGSTTTAFTNFLIGEPASSISYNGAPRPDMDVHNWENGYYVQDDFRVNARLMLNLGMRYDTLPGYTDKNDILANFDPNYSNPVTGQVGRYVVPSEKTLKYLDAGFAPIGVVTAAQSGLGVGRSLVNTDHSDFGPRVGAAFRITEKNVVRGGFGIYYPTSSAQIYRDAIATNPFSAPVTTRPAKGASFPAFPRGGETTGVVLNQGGTVSGFGNTPSANFVPVGLKNARLYNWNATFERQLPHETTVRVSYIGAHQTGQVAGADADMILPSDNPFGTTTGDGVTPCDPVNNGDCAYSAADNARIRFPLLGDYVTGFKNYGHSVTNSFQGQVERRANGFTFSAAYTLLDQKSSGIDVGNASLGGNVYNPFQPDSDYSRDSYVSRHRVVAYVVYDVPVGRGQRFNAGSSRFADALVGGWQISSNMFAKSGIGLTPFWQCDNCDPVVPGNVASGAIDAIGGFGGTFRPRLVGDPTQGVQKGFQWNPNAFDLPSIGADLLTNPMNAKRNALLVPGTYGVNLGLHKNLHVTDRFLLEIGADFDNVLNHPMLSPDQNSAGGSFAQVGEFSIGVDQTTPVTPGHQPALLPLYKPTDASPNSNVILNKGFGLLNHSYSQEGISSSRIVRLRGRITF